MEGVNRGTGQWAKGKKKTKTPWNQPGGRRAKKRGQKQGVGVQIRAEGLWIKKVTGMVARGAVRGWPSGSQ